MTLPPPYTVTGSGLALALRVTPKARRNRIEGVVDDGDGGSALKLAVTAAPEGGKANAAVIALLAKEWRLAKSAFAVTRGATGRKKTLTIAGDGPALKERLDDWFAASKGGRGDG